MSENKKFSVEPRIAKRAYEIDDEIESMVWLMYRCNGIANSLVDAITEYCNENKIDIQDFLNYVINDYCGRDEYKISKICPLTEKAERLIDKYFIRLSHRFQSIYHELHCVDDL